MSVQSDRYHVLLGRLEKKEAHDAPHHSVTIEKKDVEDKHLRHDYDRLIEEIDKKNKGSDALSEFRRYR